MGKVGPQALEGLVVVTPLMLGAAFLGLRGFERLSTCMYQRAVIGLAILGAVGAWVGQLCQAFSSEVLRCYADLGHLSLLGWLGGISQPSACSRTPGVLHA